jgi:hypothetical protein
MTPEQRLQKADRGKEIPGGSVLPLERHYDRNSAAAGAKRGHRAAYPVFYRKI